LLTLWLSIPLSRWVKPNEDVSSIY